MNMKQAVAFIRDRRRHLQTAVVSVAGTAFLFGVNLFGFIWSDRQLNAHPDSYGPNAWALSASLRTMLLVWSMMLGASIGWLISELRRRTLRNVVVHLLDRIEDLEAQLQRLEKRDSEHTSEGIRRPAAGPPKPPG